MVSIVDRLNLPHPADGGFIGFAGEGLFAANWGDYGGGFENCRAWLLGTFVVLEGLARRTATGSATETLATLPEPYRPLGDTHIFLCCASNASSALRVNVFSSGIIEVQNHDTGNGEWVSLSGIIYTANY